MFGAAQRWFWWSAGGSGPLTPTGPQRQFLGRQYAGRQFVGRQFHSPGSLGSSRVPWHLFLGTFGGR